MKVSSLPPHRLGGIGLCPPLAALVCILQTAAAQDLDLPLSQSQWIPLYTVRTGGGYRDNVLLSDLHQQKSPFVAAAAELFLARLPDRFGELNLFLSYEDTRYLNPIEVAKEQLAFAQVHWTQSLEERTQTGLQLDYVFQNQVLDVSTTQADLDVLQVRGHSLTAQPGLRWDPSPEVWRTEVLLRLQRHWFEPPLDDFLEFGPKALLAYSYRHESEAHISYEFRHGEYDEEERRDPHGIPVLGTTRAFQQQETQLVWRHYWEGGRKWRSTTRLSWKENTDLGGHYFDFTRYQAAHELRFRTAAWEILAEARLAHYRYDKQTVSPDNPEKRTRDEIRFRLRLERSLARFLKIYAEFERERIQSNLRLDDYSVQTAQGGLIWEF